MVVGSGPTRLKIILRFGWSFPPSKVRILAIAGSSARADRLLGRIVGRLCTEAACSLVSNSGLTPQAERAVRTLMLDCEPAVFGCVSRQYINLWRRSSFMACDGRPYFGGSRAAPRLVHAVWVSVLFWVYAWLRRALSFVWDLIVQYGNMVLRDERSVLGVCYLHFVRRSTSYAVQNSNHEEAC